MAPTPTPSRKFHVLLTGYGPFGTVSTNPSWYAIAPLHNTLIRTASASIHITAVGPVPVAYDAVLALVPGLFARPPRLPPSSSDGASDSDAVPPPPPEGYDLVFSLGAGAPGSLSLEQVGHKSGYELPGVDGQFAPVISRDADTHGSKPSEAQRFEASRLRSNGDDTSHANVNRGFTEGYEAFPEELHTEVDVQGVIAHLNAQGESHVTASTDAGHFLCDFICYCILAESQRHLFDPKSSDTPNPRRTKALFMHVPLPGKPHALAEMTSAVRHIVAWVCAGEGVTEEGA